jgi:hypothetical protein
VKRWSRRKAATAAGFNDGTIRAMEQGRNAGWDYFETYAKALGISFEQVCRDVLHLEDVALDENQRIVLETLDSLQDRPDELRDFMGLVRVFRRQRQQGAPAWPASGTQASAPGHGSRESIDETRSRARKSRSTSTTRRNEATT